MGVKSKLPTIKLEQIVVCLYNGISFGHEKEWGSNHVSLSTENIVLGFKPEPEDHIPCAPFVWSTQNREIYRTGSMAVKSKRGEEQSIC